MHMVQCHVGAGFTRFTPAPNAGGGKPRPYMLVQWAYDVYRLSNTRQSNLPAAADVGCGDLASEAIEPDAGVGVGRASRQDRVEEGDALEAAEH